MNNHHDTRQFLLLPTALFCVLLRAVVTPAGAQGADSTAETNPLHAAAPDRVSARPELLITTLGFGSCARQERPQPIWNTINAVRCDAFVLCGDNIYGDSSGSGCAPQ